MHIVLVLDLGSPPLNHTVTLGNSLKLSFSFLVGNDGPHMVVLTVK